MNFNFYFDSTPATPSQFWLNFYIPLFTSIPHPIAIKSDSLYVDSGNVGVRDAYSVSFAAFGFTTGVNPTTITVSGVTFTIVVNSQFTGVPNQINSGLIADGSAFDVGFSWTLFAANLGTALASCEALKGKILVDFGLGANRVNNLKLCDGTDATTVIDEINPPHLEFFVVGFQIGLPIEFSTTSNATVIQYCTAGYGSIQNLLKMFAQVQMTPIVNYDSDSDVTNGYVNIPQVIAQPQIMPFNIETSPVYPSVENPNRLFWFDFAKMAGDYMKPPVFYNQSELNVYESWRNCTAYFGITADGISQYKNIGAATSSFPFYAIDYYEKETATARAVYNQKDNLFFFPVFTDFESRFTQSADQPYFTSQKYRPWLFEGKNQNCCKITGTRLNANLCFWNQGIDGISNPPPMEVWSDGILVLTTDTSVVGLTFPADSKVSHIDFIPYIEFLVTFLSLDFKEIYFVIQSDGFNVTSPIFTNESQNPEIKGLLFFKNKFGYLDILIVKRIFRELETIENEIFTNATPNPLFTTFENQSILPQESIYNIVPTEIFSVCIGFLNIDESKEVIKQLLYSNTFYFTEGVDIQKPCILVNKEQIMKDLSNGTIELNLNLRFLGNER